MKTTLKRQSPWRKYGILTLLVALLIMGGSSAFANEGYAQVRVQETSYHGHHHHRYHHRHHSNRGHWGYHNGVRVWITL
ncbi:MAG: hypothetical protein V4507_04675 [Verrucomicrobiota bacterium]